MVSMVCLHGQSCIVFYEAGMKVVYCIPVQVIGSNWITWEHWELEGTVGNNGSFLQPPLPPSSSLSSSFFLLSSSFFFKKENRIDVYLANLVIIWIWIYYCFKINRLLLLLFFNEDLLIFWNRLWSSVTQLYDLSKHIRSPEKTCVQRDQSLKHHLFVQGTFYTRQKIFKHVYKLVHSSSICFHKKQSMCLSISVITNKFCSFFFILTTHLLFR